MIHYYRLLFFGSVLLILLGLFTRNSENSGPNTGESGHIEWVELQEGLLPFLPNYSFDPWEEKNAIDRNEKISFNLVDTEYGFTENTRVRMHTQVRDFMSQKPGFLFGTGLQFHFTFGETDPFFV